MQARFGGEMLALGDEGGGGASMGRIQETRFNHALGRALRGKRAAWRSPNAVIYERTEVLADERAKRPDILVVTPGAAPVSIELEWEAPAEHDARDRLGKAVKGGGQIRSAIAVGAPREAAGWTDAQGIAPPTFLFGQACLGREDALSADRNPCSSHQARCGLGSL